jgi:hypothetical protein
MAQLTARDKRTLRIAAIGLAIYLIVFLVFKWWKSSEKAGEGFGQLLARAQREQQEARRQENDLLRFEKLCDTYGFDPRALPKETLVAQAATAIQNAARQGGIKLGPVRETPGRSDARELSTIQFDGAGQPASVLALLHKLQTLGYPLVIETLQFSQDAKQPNMLKVNVTLQILNFEHWQKGSVPNA